MDYQNVLEDMNRQSELMELDGELARQRVEQAMHDMRETERLIFGCERTMRAVELMELDGELARQRVEQAMHDMRETERLIFGCERTIEEIEIADPLHQVQATPRLEKDIDPPKIVVRQSRPIPIPDEEEIVVRVSRPIRLRKAVSSDSDSR